MANAETEQTAYYEARGSLLKVGLKVGELVLGVGFLSVGVDTFVRGLATGSLSEMGLGAVAAVGGIEIVRNVPE